MESRFIAIPLKDSQEDDGGHLKRLRRFSIEVWNLTQNWGDASSRAAKSLENIINSRLQLLYSKEQQNEETIMTSDEKSRQIAKIVEQNEILNCSLDDLEKIIGKFETAFGRIAAWKQLIANSSNKESIFIVETLESVLPDLIKMLKTELNVKKTGLLDVANNENRNVFTCILLAFKYEPFVDTNFLSKLYALEVIEISCDELPEGSEVLAILEAEEARLSSWIEVAIEYYRHQRIEPFLLILESAGSRAGLNYASVKSDQMRALDILAAHWMHCGFREKQKDKRQDFFSKATVLFNTADKILMYDSSHLTVRAWFYLYEKETRTNKLDLADQQFNYVVKTQPTNVLSLIGKAVISFNKKDAKLAVYYFRKALRQKRHSIAALRVGLGYSFSKLGQFDKARLAFERALELEDNSVSAMVGLAIILLNTMEPDNFNMAINLFGKAYDLMPDHPVVLVHLANHFFFKREYENVQQLAWHAMQSTESDAIKSEACYQLARLKHAQHQYESAFKYYYQSKNLNNGEHTLAFFGLGQLYIYRNELEEVSGF
ncbi:unnamed protein product [Caenorhabditis angaria]|uniref:Uncharacterized protein n=1 Tax=Caenorhabditis angaria TaxID=860376 RepID=A0A9P1IIG1_9PELO|nr:unnamed protein product [Caenorhabditis angaria]